MICTEQGCFTRAEALASRWKRRTNVRSFESSWFMILRATSRGSPACSATYTVAMPPSPRTRWMVNLPATCFPRSAFCLTATDRCNVISPRTGAYQRKRRGPAGKTARGGSGSPEAPPRLRGVLRRTCARALPRGARGRRRSLKAHLLQVVVGLHPGGRERLGVDPDHGDRQRAMQEELRALALHGEVDAEFSLGRERYVLLLGLLLAVREHCHRGAVVRVREVVPLVFQRHVGARGTPREIGCVHMGHGTPGRVISVVEGQHRRDDGAFPIRPRDHRLFVIDRRIQDPDLDRTVVVAFDGGG